MRRDVLLRADRFDELVDRLVRAAVQRPLQRADRRRNRAIHVAQRRSRHQRRERRCVHLVLGVEDHRDIEHPLFEGIGLAAVEHPEEVRRMAEVVARGHRLEALAEAMEAREDGRHDRRQPGGRLLQLRVREVARVLIQRARGDNRHFQGSHWPYLAHDLREDARVQVRQVPLGQQRLLQRGEFRGSRETQVPEEERDLFERRLLCQVEDVVPGVDEFALDAIDTAELRRGDVDAFEASGNGLGHGQLLRIVYSGHILPSARSIRPSFWGQRSVFPATDSDCAYRSYESLISAVILVTKVTSLDQIAHVTCGLP